jgi:hypothetical protein
MSIKSFKDKQAIESEGVKGSIDNIAILVGNLNFINFK